MESKNEEIVKFLSKELERNEKKLNEHKERLFGNYSFEFKWVAGTCLHLQIKNNILEKIIMADSNKVGHLQYFVKTQTERIFSYSPTNQSTNPLSNYQDMVEFEVNKELTSLFTHLLKED